MNHLPHFILHSCYSQVIKDISLRSQCVSQIMHVFNVIIILRPTIFVQDVLHTCKTREYFLKLEDAPILLIPITKTP